MGPTIYVKNKKKRILQNVQICKNLKHFMKSSTNSNNKAGKQLDETKTIIKNI